MLVCFRPLENEMFISYPACKLVRTLESTTQVGLQTTTSDLPIWIETALSALGRQTGLRPYQTVSCIRPYQVESKEERRMHDE